MYLVHLAIIIYPVSVHCVVVLLCSGIARYVISIHLRSLLRIHSTDLFLKELLKACTIHRVVHDHGLMIAVPSYTVRSSLNTCCERITHKLQRVNVLQRNITFVKRITCSYTDTVVPTNLCNTIVQQCSTFTSFHLVTCNI